VPGSKTLSLVNPIDLILAASLHDLLCAAPNDHVHLLGRQVQCGVQEVAQKGPATHGLQYFGQAGFHPRAFASGQDNDMQGCAHSVSMFHAGQRHDSIAGTT
jgi:hypothetical protein